MSRQRRRALAHVIALAGLTMVPRAQAQGSEATPAQLADAREKFMAALEDEQAGRFPACVAKLQQVAAVRSTAAVRFRWASCEEGSGKLRAARDRFRSLAAEQSTLEGDQLEVAKAAGPRADALDRRLAKLTVRTAPGEPEGSVVTVDGERVTMASGEGRAEVDPGDHVVRVEAEGRAPRESKVSVAEGERRDVALASAAESPPTAPEPAQEGGDRTMAYVALGVGAGLLAGGGALLLVREGEISDIERMCPGGVCFESSRDAVESAQSRANVQGVLGVGLGVVGLAAAGYGTYLLLRPSPTSQAAVRPTLGGAMLTWSTAIP